MIQSIRFKGYKIFKQWQTLELRPLTVVIGKNSSGKSALLELPMLLAPALAGEPSMPPLEFTPFCDLVYGRRITGRLLLEIKGKDTVLHAVIGANQGEAATYGDPEIMEYILNGQPRDLSGQFDGLVPAGESLAELKTKWEHIGTERAMPKKVYDKPSARLVKIGKDGGNVYEILIADALTSERKLLRAVSDFYVKSFEGWGLRVNEESRKHYELELEKEELKINLTEVGAGMIFALPLVVNALMPPKEETLTIIEEPEMHLHPAAHGNLAELLASNLTNRRYLIETHSQNFVLRLRRMVAEGKIPAKDLAIYFVDFDEELNESNLVRMDVDDLGKTRKEDGTVFWPQNIFSESLNETTAIRTAQINKQSPHAY